ncbi:UDP-N-acetylmuramoylalanyl-D-glutamyl-2, 6-diaminopimelate--D-alanyl-D-alanine ligase, partial [bacterium]|nr:UDP-N-acetylmuramoylalanyl-D-glutamyl-2, 6-diaminopimelate--D-alanyl-D-alanine ligase [bacterium]
MRLAAAEVLAACRGEARGIPPTLPMRVVHDSRLVEKGDLFVGLPGERTHGADHAAQAIAQGAAGMVLPPDRGRDSRWTVRVADPLAAYGRLAGHARRRWGGRVAAVAGSIGKSTIKELLAAALGEPGAVARSPASYNNEVGLPWTILAASGGERHLVLEMGARKPGDLAYLEEIAAPNVAVYAPIADSHGEHLGGPEGVQRE